MAAVAAPLKHDATLNDSALPDQHPPKFLDQALRDYAASRPPFVRQCTKKEFSSSKTVTLATQRGRFPQQVIPAILTTRKWDLKSSYQTIDRKGERLIVKAFGKSAWSSDDLEDQNISDMDSDDDVETNLEEVVVHERDEAESEDYFPQSSRESSPKNDAQQDSSLQGTTKESDIPKPPATRAPLTYLNASQDDGAARDSEVGPSIAPRAEFPPLRPSQAETSTATPRNSEAAHSKRQAPDVAQDDRSSKKGRPEREDTKINNTANARVPPTLTIYKQERTILYVCLPGSVSNMVAIKLCSAMSIPALFSSVCSVVGIKEYVNLAIAIMFEREDGGVDRSLIIKRNSVEAFEVFLEAVDEAPCWNAEGGKLSFRLHLKSMVEVEMAMRV